MNDCRNCGKVIKLAPHTPLCVITFCDYKCLSEWAEEYAQKNWKDVARMMGARIVE